MVEKIYIYVLLKIAEIGLLTTYRGSSELYSGFNILVNGFFSKFTKKVYSNRVIYFDQASAILWANSPSQEIHPPYKLSESLRLFNL